MEGRAELDGKGQVTAGKVSKVATDRKARARAAMLTAPIFPTLLKLAVPTIIVLVAQTFVGIAETYYVSFLGTDALAGVALVFPVLMLMTMMSNGGIGGGVASAAARAIGAGRSKDADALVFHSLILAVICGCVFSAGLSLFGPIFYRTLGGAGPSLDAALSYSSYVFAGAVPVWIVNLISAALRGSGNVRIPAIVTLIGAIVLVPLSPALIFGFGPLPRLGIAGAGIAVSSYYTVAAVVLLRYMANGRSGLVLRRGPLEPRLFRDILRVGLISAVGAMQPNLTVIAVTGAVGMFGIDSIAGYGMASRLDYMLIPTLFGLGTAVLAMVGANTGAGNLARARRITWIGTLVGASFTGSVGLLAALFPAVWLHLFSRDPAVITSGSLYLQTVAPFYGAVGITFVLGLASQGGGRPIWPFLGGTARMIIAAGLGWVAVFVWRSGLPTLFAIVAASSAVSALICLAAALSGAIWQKSFPSEEAVAIPNGVSVSAKS